METYTREQMLETSTALLEDVEKRIQEKSALVDTLLEALADTGDVALLNFARAHTYLPHLRSSYQLKAWEGEPHYFRHQIMGFIRKYYSEDLGLPPLLRSQKNLLADIEEYKQAIARGEA